MRRKAKTRIIILGSFLLLVGCAAPRPQYTWTKPGIKTIETDYMIENSACEAESYKAIPAGSMAESDCSTLKGFARGVCNGQAARERENLLSLRARIYEGCMMGKGWRKQQLPE